MFLREELCKEIVEATNRSFHINFKMQFFKCDNCEKMFSRRSAKKKYISASYHFCNKKCLNLASCKGGVIFEKKKKNCIEKYGVEHHLSSPEIQEKRTKTCEEKFGGPSPMNSQQTKEKAKNTIIERYGDHFSRTDVVKEKRRTTCIEKYGVDSYSKTNEFKSQINWRDINQKGYKTRKENGISPVSKIEQKFGEFLQEQFGKVESQVDINGWLIDFYLPDLDVYVQFDGDYWHGLDVTVEQLMSQANEKPQFATIAKTKFRDQEKVEWFSQNGLKLVRIRESLFKQKKYDEVLALLKGRRDGLQAV